MTKEIHTVLTDMPTTIGGFVRKNADFSHTIVINAKLTRERQLKTYKHELEHIRNDDFEKYNVDEVELETRRMNCRNL